MSQKDIHKILDVKILDYLNTSDSKEESKEMPVDENGDISFGQSVAAQLRKMNTRQNALAKAKIQMILLEVQFPESPSHVMSVPNTNYLPFCQNRFNFQLPGDRGIEKAVQNIREILKKPSLIVPDGYFEKFSLANNTFQHQSVFNPLSRKVVPLSGDVSNEYVLSRCQYPFKLRKKYTSVNKCQ